MRGIVSVPALILFRSLCIVLLIAATVGLLLLPPFILADPEIPLKKITIHVLLLMDTKDPKIGKSVEKDVERLKWLFELPSRNKKGETPAPLLWSGNDGKALPKEVVAKITIYSAVDVKPTDDVRDYVRNYYKNLTVDPDDALVFYYSGHGGINPESRDASTPESRDASTNFYPGHFFNFDGQNLYRSDVRSWMTVKKPRAVFIVSDCCSTFVDNSVLAAGLLQQFGGTKFEGKSMIVTSNWMRFYCGKSGVFEMTSSEKGKPSYCGPETGGYFTVAFVGSFGFRLGLLKEDSWKYVADRTILGIEKLPDSQKPVWDAHK